MNMISSAHSLRLSLFPLAPSMNMTEVARKTIEDKLFFERRRAWTEDELDTETLRKMAHLVAHKGELHDMAWQNADAITLELDPSFVPTSLPVN